MPCTSIVQDKFIFTPGADMASISDSIASIFEVTAFHQNAVLRVSVERKLVLVFLGKRLDLVLLSEEVIADRQHLNVCTHKTAKSIFWCADNRLAADIETCVY